MVAVGLDYLVSTDDVIDLFNEFGVQDIASCVVQH